jgi:CRISPR/Cas system-associated exonuclease Cas4 (RecB family)
MVEYSYSKIIVFQQCPLKFFLKYLKKPRIKVMEGIECFTGRMVHQALKEFFKQEKNGKIFLMNDFLKFFNCLWTENFYNNKIMLKPGQKEKKFKKIGEKCLKNFYNSIKSSNSITLGFEEKFKIVLNKKKNFFLIGVIDRIAKNKEGLIEVHEYKTTLNKNSIQETIKKSNQLALYSLGIQKKFSNIKPENILLAWNFLFYNKTIKTRKTLQELKELKKKTIQQIQLIEKAKKHSFFPAKKSNYCNWCEYFKYCKEENYT